MALNPGKPHEVNGIFSGVMLWTSSTVVEKFMVQSLPIDPLLIFLLVFVPSILTLG